MKVTNGHRMSRHGEDKTIDIELTGLETSSGHFTFASTGREMKLRAQFGGKLLNN